MSGQRAPAVERLRVHHALEYGAWGAVTVNLILVPLFWLTHIRSLALFSVGSVAFYLCCLRLLKQRRVSLVVTLTFIEIASHVPLVVYVLGADGGFQYYLLAIAPVVFVAAPQYPVISGGLAALLLAMFIALDLLARVTAPLLALDAHMLGCIRYTNIVAAFGLASYVAWRYGRKMMRIEGDLAAAADTDPLTGLSNRRCAARQIQREISRSERTSSPLVLALVDIDRFKTINDEHGHDVGDQVIVAVADRLRDGLRTSDLVARWGGEEFLMVLPGATEEAGAETAERIRQTIADTPVKVSAGDVRVSVTIGVAERRPDESLSTWVNRADQALYAGKEAGRNRTGVWRPAGAEGGRVIAELIPANPVQTGAS